MARNKGVFVGNSSGVGKAVNGRARIAQLMRDAEKA